MARQAKTAVYIATESFSCELDGDLYTVAKGDRVRAGHPLIAAQGSSFEDVGEHVRFEWETAVDTAPTRSK